MEPMRIMLVDDEERFLSTTQRLLEKKGVPVVTAAGGAEALEKLHMENVHVVILDIKMPGMDGHEALSRIKALRPDAQVIMLTGYGSRESAEASLEHEAFDYLNKPCDIDLLDSRIREAYAAAHRKTPQEEKKARDIMIPVEDYTTLQADATIREGIEGLFQSFESMASTSRIMETGHRSILVFEGEGLAGILSIRDLISALQPAYLTAPKPSMADSMVYSTMFWTGLFTKQVQILRNKRIRDLMSGPPLTVDEEANLMEVANTLYSEKVRRLVVKSRGKVIGVVREQDLFFELARIILGA